MRSRSWGTARSPAPPGAKVIDVKEIDVSELEGQIVQMGG
jgi:hypothetical protein